MTTDDYDPTLTEEFEPEPLIDGRYRVLSVIGRGGFGEVKLVEDTLRRGQRLALKSILPQHSTTTEFEKRFHREIDVLRSLQHENIPSIVNDGRDADGTFYFTMEFVEGVPLGRLVKDDGPLEPMRLARIVRQLARTLDYAHSKGVVHRDLKPGNILVTEPGTSDERVHVLDFGIAKLMEQPEGAPSVTLETAGFIGTPEFASPEQVLGEDVDGRTDIYALGILIHYLATGKFPFAGKSRQEVATKRLHTPPTPLAREEAPPEIRTIVKSLLERDREQRPPLSDVSSALDKVLDGIGGFVEEQRSTRRMLGALLGLGIAGLVATAILLTKDGPEPVGPAEPRTTSDNETVLAVGEGQDDGVTSSDNPGSAIDVPGEPAESGEAPALTPSDEDSGSPEEDPERGPAALSPPAEADTTAPSLVVRGPLSGPWTETSDEVEFMGRTLDESEGGSVTLTINGTPLDIGPDGKFLTLLPLPTLGTHTFLTVAEDAAGNRTERTYEIERVAEPDMDDPVIVIAESGTPPVCGVKEARVGGQVTDDSDVTLTINGVETSISSLGLFDAVVPLAKVGENRVEFVAVDERGNRTTEVRTLTRLPEALTLEVEGGVGPHEAAADRGMWTIDGALAGWTSGREAIVRVAGNELDLVEGRFSGIRPLAPGKNVIELTLEQEGAPTARLEITVTRRSPSIPSGARLPEVTGFSGDRPLSILVGEQGIELRLVEPEPTTGLDAYYISVSEVSAAQFAAAPLGAGVNGALPKVNVDAADAAAFAEGLGGALPTAEQWRVAAWDGAAVGPRFPWGDEWAPTRCNSKDHGLGRTAEVTDDSFASGRTPALGLWHMAGNVSEWVELGVRKYAPMGGSYRNSEARCALDFEPRAMGSSLGREMIGFRIVLPAPAPR